MYFKLLLYPDKYRAIAMSTTKERWGWAPCCTKQPTYNIRKTEKQKQAPRLCGSRRWRNQGELQNKTTGNYAFLVSSNPVCLTLQQIDSSYHDKLVLAYWLPLLLLLPMRVFVYVGSCWSCAIAHCGRKCNASSSNATGTAPAGLCIAIS